MIERIYYRVKLNTDQIIYSQNIEAKLNENIIKDPSKTYLVWKGDKFPNDTIATFKAPAGCTIDWGDGNVETFETASTEVNTHTYTDGFEYHLISLSNYTVIDNSAFYGCSSLTSVTIGNSVTSIGDNAFRDCSGLTSITIPDSVTSIGDNAFFGCRGLTSVTIPDSVTGIGYQAFYNCSSLTSVTIPDSVTTISFATFSGCIGLTSVTIGNSVRNIGSSAFDGCSGLTSITIPDSVTSIGSSAFSGCSGLKTIKISAINPPTLKSDAFAETPLEKILVPKSAINAYKSAAGWSTYADKIVYEVDSSDLVSLEAKLNENIVKDPSKTYLVWKGDKFPNSTNATFKAPASCVIDWGDGNVETFVAASTEVNTHTYTDGIEYHLISLSNYIIIGNSAFEYCRGLTSVTIGNGVTSIGDSAFFSCSGLTSVTIPNSVTSIGSQAFYNCIGLTSVTIPNSVTSIGNSAFYDCRGLTSVIWNAENCTSAGSSSYPIFSGCSKLTNVTIGENVKTIPNYAFYGCTVLTSVTIGNNVTFIGDYAFYDCRKLTSIIIPDSVTSIGNGAFYGCSGLTSVTIGNGVTSIGSEAFRGCSGLTSVTIGNGVTSIGDRAFQNCSNLKTIRISAINPPTLGSNVFETSIEKIIVPKSAINAYKSAAGWSTYADKIVYEVDSSDLNAAVTNLENGTGDVLIQTTDSNQSFKVMTDGRAKVQTAPVDTDDVVRKLELDKKFDKAGGTVTGDMVVGGNFTVQGKTTTVDSETLRVTDRLIEVGKGNTAPLTSPAGLFTPKYDGQNNGGIVYDNTGTAYVGDITLDSNGNIDVSNSDLQPIATRSDLITNGNLIKWDDTNKTLVGSGKKIDDLSTATNLENGAGAGSIQQTGITYDELITDYEPNMAAWVIAKNGNVAPTDVPTYLTALGNDTVPTSAQVVDILNNRKNDVNTVITNFKTLPSPYESYGIDSLITGALEGYGLTSSSDLSNDVGKVGFAAAILGAMNKAFSPGAFAGGVGCEAGDEGCPGDTVCSFAYGSNVKTKGICAIGVGRDLENLGDTSAVFGRGNKEYKIEGSEADKSNQRIYLNNLAEAGGTVTGTGDDRVCETGINKGTDNFMAGNSHYIGEGADNNTVVGNQNIIGKRDNNSNNANNFVSGSINYIDLSISCGIIGDRNRLRGSFNSLLVGNNLKASSCKGTLGAGQYNAGVGDDTRFFVGNGTSEADRKNAFEVLQDGRAKVQSAPTENDDIVRKLELDNVNARYVSTSILGG